MTCTQLGVLKIGENSVNAFSINVPLTDKQVVGFY